MLCSVCSECLGLLKILVRVAAVGLAAWKVELEGVNSVLISLDSSEELGRAVACFLSRTREVDRTML